MRVEFRIARIDALRREREKEIDTGSETSCLEHRPDQFLCRPRIGGGFEDDQHSRVKVCRDGFDGRHDVGHVGVFRFPQRRRHADVDRVERGDGGEIGRRPKLSIADEASDLRARDVGDVRRPPADRLDLAAVEVDSRRGESVSCKLDGEGQADVSEADDADARASRLNVIQQLLRR